MLLGGAGSVPAQDAAATPAPGTVTPSRKLTAVMVAADPRARTVTVKRLTHAGVADATDSLDDSAVVLRVAPAAAASLRLLRAEEEITLTCRPSRGVPTAAPRATPGGLVEWSGARPTPPTDSTAVGSAGRIDAAPAPATPEPTPMTLPVEDTRSSRFTTQEAADRQCAVVLEVGPAGQY
jgi:hypothetical protein